MLKDWAVHLDKSRLMVNETRSSASLVNAAQKTLASLIADDKIESLFYESDSPTGSKLSLDRGTNPVPFSVTGGTTVFVCGLGPIDVGIAKTLGKSPFRTCAFDVFKDRLDQLSEHVGAVSLFHGLEHADHV